MRNMTAAQQQAEQALLTAAQSQYETLRALITERDQYRDALMKIANIRYKPLTFEEKADRANEISNTVLGEFE